MQTIPVKNLDRETILAQLMFWIYFNFEDIYGSNGIPYLSFGPSDYRPAGPQMEVGPSVRI